MDAHLNRIEREAGLPGLADALATLPPTDLKSLLLHVFREQTARRDPATLLEQYERDGTVAPAASNHALDGAALAAAEGFEPLELAPVSPLGLNAVLGRIDQNNVLSTARTSEVLADPTAALALECAVRRRRGDANVRLSAVCRVLRLQPLPDIPGYTPHFRIFALVTAGRAQPSYGFEIEALREHFAVYRRLLDALGIEGSTAELGDTRGITRIHEALPETTFDAERGSTYYDGPLLRVSATDPEGITYPLADGGCVPWTQRLLSNRKERLLISGIGLGLIGSRWPNAGSRAPQRRGS